MTEKTSWAKDHVPFTKMFGIVTDKTRKTAHNILDTPYLIREWDLPEKQVLISGDGHWWITLDYRNRDVPSLRWIDTDCDEDIHIAHNFDEFLNGLVSSDAFAD